MNRKAKEIIRRILPRAIRPYRILNGFLRGRIIYTSLHDYPAAILGRTETDLVTWLVSHVHKGEVWIDIGAHYGYISMLLSILTGAEGQVYAFEPMVTTAGCLIKTRNANRLQQMVVVPLALGAADEPALLQLPVTRGMADATFQQGEEYESIIQVSLDKLWKSLSCGDKKASGVKIDVQGMELDVLAGMKTVLTIDRPVILLEFHTGVDRPRIAGLLEMCGYKLPGRDLATGQPVIDLAYQDNQTYMFEPAKLD